MIKSDGPYVIVGDDSGHEYVIPENKYDEWEAYLTNIVEFNYDDDAAVFPDEPEWVDSLCHGSLLIHSYEIE